MKQSYGRLLAARLMSPAAAMGLAAAVVAGISACHNNSSTPCPNLSQASFVIGEPNFTAAQNASTTAASLAGPTGSVAQDPSTGHIYVADTYNNRIVIYSTPVAANAPTAIGVLGQPCFATSSTGIGAVTSLPATCNGSGSLNAYGLSGPQKVWIDPASRQMAIADTGNNRVLIFSTPPTSNTTAPTAIVGQSDINSNTQNAGGISASSLYGPTAAVITDGQLLVADQSNNRVLIWSTVPTTNFALADNELGQINYPTTNSSGTLGPSCTTNTGSTGFCFTTNIPNTQDHFNSTNGEYNVLMNHPTDIWASSSFTIVSDSAFNRVLYYQGIPNAASNGYNQQPNILLGVPTFNYGYSKPGSGAQNFNNPTGLAVSGQALFVADTGNNRVLQFLLPISTQVAAQEVFGQQDFSHTTQNDPDQNGQVGDQRNNPATIGPVNGTLWSPTGVFDDGSGNLYVTDTLNARVLLYPAGGGVNGTDTNLCS